LHFNFIKLLFSGIGQKVAIHRLKENSEILDSDELPCELAPNETLIPVVIISNYSSESFVRVRLSII